MNNIKNVLKNKETFSISKWIEAAKKDMINKFGEFPIRSSIEMPIKTYCKKCGFVAYDRIAYAMDNYTPGNVEDYYKNDIYQHINCKDSDKCYIKAEKTYKQEKN